MNPEERILKALNKKEYSYSALYDIVRKQKQIQYDAFKSKLQKMSDMGVIVIIENYETNTSGNRMMINSRVKLVKKKK